MQIAPIALLVGALLLAAGSLWRAPLAIAFFGSLAFGSTAVASLPALGGATLLLYVPLAGLLVAAALLRRTIWQDLGRVLRHHGTSVVVLILLIYAVSSAFIMPRLFLGEATVFVPSRGRVVETSLMPVSGNLNQAGYFAIGIVTFFAVASLLEREGRFDVIRKGFFAFAIVHCALGLIDLAAKASGAGDLLAPIRTAGYSMLTEVQVEGFWRIVGGYPEASTFGGATIIALAFTFSQWRAAGGTATLALAVVLLLLLLLSTSTTGYASLSILLMLLALCGLWRLLRDRLRGRDLLVLIGGLAASAVIFALLVFSHQVLDPIIRLIETTVLEKSASASADERFYWNYKSWLAFLDTYGLGVGLGSSRASSSIFAILSQLGIVGVLLIAALLMEFAKPIPRPGPDPEAIELATLCNSLRSTGFAAMLPAAIAGGSADPGIVFFIALATLLVGRSHLQRMRMEEVRSRHRSLELSYS